MTDPLQETIAPTLESARADVVDIPAALEPDNGPAPGTRALIGLTALMALSAVALATILPTNVLWGGHHVSLHPLVICGVVALSELCSVHVHFRRETHTVSLREIPLVVCLFLAAPFALIFGYIVGSGLVLGLRARQRGLKLMFNTSLVALEVTVGLAVFRAFAGTGELGSPRTWLAAGMAAVVVDTLGGVLVTFAIWLRQGTFEAGSVGWLALTGTFTSTSNASFGLLTVILVETSPAAALLLVGVAGTMFALYRSYTTLRQRHSHLELLQEFTSSVGAEIAFQDIAMAALRKASDLLAGDHAELWFLPPNSDREMVRIVVKGGERVVIDRRHHLEVANLLWSQLVASNECMLITRKVRDEQLRRVLDEHRCKDLVAAPLHTERGLVGMMLVGNRLGDVATFNTDDRGLLVTLARYTSMALENGRLVDELQQEADRRQHEALHDPLTGLANRRCFVERAERLLSGVRRGDNNCGVLLLDLDRFKDVNDTFGHPSGDELLVEVAARLRQVVREPDVIARLGGDEFAILLANLNGSDEAHLAAQRLHDAIALPYDVGNVSVQVDVSIGIALFPDHGPDVSTLLRCADIAMYVAKDLRTSASVYSPMHDYHTPERLALAAELRAAIESGDFALGYQPTKDVATGAIVGVEALARWEHPTRGLLPPPTYITVAEQTGLILQLTRFVLRSALEQRHAWAEQGIDLRVAVNISVHDLQSPDFAACVASLLDATQTPPGRLVLEITETKAMERPERIAPVLNALRDRGVVIAIDDFGTGFSSLTSLRSLPIDEIKIDQSFVRDVTINEYDDAIVRSIVELARRLKLHIVAEGVENELTEAYLKELGCHVVQGYFLSRALPPDELEHWLLAHENAEAATSGHEPTGDVIPLLSAVRLNTAVQA